MFKFKMADGHLIGKHHYDLISVADLSIFSQKYYEDAKHDITDSQHSQM